MAKEYENIKNINAAAIDYIRANIPSEYQINSVKSGRIDSRLKLAKCQETLYGMTTRDFKVSKSYTVAVYCDQPNWKIYVSVKADISQQVVVAKDTIFRNDIISENDVTIEKRPLQRSKRYFFKNIADVIGKQAKRNINIGATIVANQLKAPLWVKRRQKVIIMAKNDIIQVKMEGIALKNGKENEVIKVRNLKSNKVVEGIVVSQGVVRVNF